MYIFQIAMKVIIYMHLYKFAVTQGIYIINSRLTFTSQGKKKNEDELFDPTCMLFKKNSKSNYEEPELMQF